MIEEENVDRDEALDILTSSLRSIEVNFQKVQANYMTEPVIETYINFLERFRELEDDSIKKYFPFSIEYLSRQKNRHCYLDLI